MIINKRSSTEIHVLERFQTKNKPSFVLAVDFIVLQNVHQ